MIKHWTITNAVVAKFYSTDAVQCSSVHGTGTCDLEDEPLQLTSAGVWVASKSDKLRTFVSENFASHSTVEVALGCSTMLGVDLGTNGWSGQRTLWWWSGLPDGLVNTLNERHADLPAVDCISLDASRRSHYFVQFEDGTSQWNGPDSLSKALHEEAHLSIDLLCFAPRNGWYAPQSKSAHLLQTLCPRGSCLRVQSTL